MIPVAEAFTREQALALARAAAERRRQWQGAVRTPIVNMPAKSWPALMAERPLPMIVKRFVHLVEPAPDERKRAPVPLNHRRLIWDDAFAMPTPKADDDGLPLSITPSLRFIEAACAAWSGMTVDDMKGNSRRLGVANARQTMVWVARTMTPKSAPEIGAWVGQGHSTILHSVAKVRKDREANPAFLAATDLLTRRIHAAWRDMAAQRKLPR